MTQKADPLKKHVDSRVGKMLNNKWQLETMIGQGGMAAVYQATHRNGKRVAVKVLHPIFPKQSNIRERFLREGYLANKVDHPGCVSVIDDDTTEDGEVFLVMELLEGVSVEELLWRFGGVMQYPYALAIADQLLDVLVAAHSKGVIHRDIKPGNLFLTRERRVKILDFGLARLLEPTPGSALTGAGMVLGTPSYMPPEQARAQWHLVDGRTDLFAVGAVLYRLLSGRSVHEAKTDSERHVLAMNRQAGSLALVAPQVPKQVVALVDKALQFEMANRWRDAATFQAAVRNAMVVLDVMGMSGATPMEGEVPPHPAAHATVQQAAPVRPQESIEVSMSELVDEAEPMRISVPGPLPEEFLKRLPETSANLIQAVLSRCDIVSIEMPTPDTLKDK